MGVCGCGCQAAGGWLLHGCVHAMSGQATSEREVGTGTRASWRGAWPQMQRSAAPRARTGAQHRSSSCPPPPPPARRMHQLASHSAAAHPADLLHWQRAGLCAHMHGWHEELPVVQHAHIVLVSAGLWGTSRQGGGVGLKGVGGADGAADAGTCSAADRCACTCSAALNRAADGAPAPARPVAAAHTPSAQPGS